VEKWTRDGTRVDSLLYAGNLASRRNGGAEAVTPAKENGTAESRLS